MKYLISLIILLLSLSSCSSDCRCDKVKTYHGIEIGYDSDYKVDEVIDNDKLLTFPLVEFGDSVILTANEGDIKVVLKFPDKSTKSIKFSTEIPIVLRASTDDNSSITFSKAMFLHIVLKMKIDETLIDDIILNIPEKQISNAHSFL